MTALKPGPLASGTNRWFSSAAVISRTRLGIASSSDRFAGLPDPRG
jgi:hypothetical protein